MVRVAPYILLGLALYLIFFYLVNYRPETGTEILIQLDVFGVTSIAQEEQKRLAAINDLSIPYDEKQVLRNRTVFMGASHKMVQLALGAPKKIVEGMLDGHTATFYIYYLPNDKRATILVLGPDDKLFKAYKGSALDVGLEAGK